MTNQICENCESIMEYDSENGGYTCKMCGASTRDGLSDEDPSYIG